jgi:hypothetical protein
MDPQPAAGGRCPITSPSPRRGNFFPVEAFEKLPDRPLERRTLLKVGGLGALATTLASIGSLAWMPKRAAALPFTSFPDIQFDIGNFIAPVQTIAGVPVHFGPVYTFLAPATLTRTPIRTDQQVLANALAKVEASYSFSPGGIFVFVAYGLPYFNRLPASLVAASMPRLSFDHNRFVLEEAVPGPTDFGMPGISKAQANFQVPVQIEHNDVLFTLRSDSLANIADVSAWFNGSNILKGKNVPSPNFNGLFNFGTSRLNFVQPGLPRQLADQLSAAGAAPFTTFNSEINPASSMWMGFVDQQVDGSAAQGATVTFAGANAGGNIGKLTTAQSGDYFDNGSIQHLSHVLDDLQQFYNKDPQLFTGAEPFSERVQYMFRSRTNNQTSGLPFPEDPNDQFTNGGGLGAPTGNLSTQQQSAFLPDLFFGPDDMATNFDPAVTDRQKLRVGHESALQRSGRAADGTPLHIRMDGPGLSSLDVPDGSTLPTLEFTAFVPTAEFFRVLRINAASLDFVEAGQNGGTAASVPPGVEAADSEDDGLERFLSATRRQNFLIPPRRQRAFPLLELT